MKPYEVVEHTAEIGIRATGRTLEELFAHMAQGMFSLIVPPEEVKRELTLPVRVAAGDRDRLLVSWLRELLFLFDTKRVIGGSFEVCFTTPTRIEATVSGEKLDLSRHHVDKEVKAVTYCDFSLTQGPEGMWTAQVIFDI